MALAPHQGYAQDDEGNVLAWPFSVRVMTDDVGSPRMAKLYKDRAGATTQSNVMTVTADDGWAPGFFRFYVLGGVYRILVYKGAWEAEELRHVGIGTNSEADQGQLNDAGYLLEVEAETTAPPSEGFVRFNNADLSLATAAHVSTTTRGGFAFGARLLELDPGASTKKNTAIFAGANGGGASFLVDSATDNSTYVTLGLSGHAGDTTFELDLYSLQREIAGPLGAAIDPTDTVEETAAFTYAEEEHAYRMVLLDVATTAIVTLPATAPVGSGFMLEQVGAGRALFQAESGASLVNELGHAKTRNVYAVVGIFVDANVGGSAARWVLHGSTGQ